MTLRVKINSVGLLSSYVFVEVFSAESERGGFDLIIGNPPWIKAGWADAAVLCELDPMLGVMDARSAEFTARRPGLLAEKNKLATAGSSTEMSPHVFYTREFTRSIGASMALNSHRLYPELAGIQTNLYKNFVVRSWSLAAAQGIVGLLHPEGLYDDPNGGTFRKAIYPRLLAYYHFLNELPFFHDAGHQGSFSLNIYGEPMTQVRFRHIANVYHTSTVGASRSHDRPAELVPGIKTDQGQWNAKPHCHRIVTITDAELRLFARLLEAPGTEYVTARLPHVHAQEIIGVVHKLSACSRRLSSLAGGYYATEIFHEANSQRDGIVTRQDAPSFQPASVADWVVSGPHFFVGTPFAKSPRTICESKGAYDDIDLTEIGEHYLPRAVYRPGDTGGDRQAIRAQIPIWPGASIPGLWPINEQGAAWEMLLGEPLHRHRVQERDYIFINECSSDGLAAIQWLTQESGATSADLSKHFPFARACQAPPTSGYLESFLQPITSRYRYVNRRRISISTERTLISTIIPPQALTIDASFTLAFLDLQQLVTFAAATHSIVLDFLVRLIGKDVCRHDVLGVLPIMELPFVQPLVARALRLNCLTRAYADLWAHVADDSIRDESWTWELDPKQANLWTRRRESAPPRDARSLSVTHTAECVGKRGEL